MSSASISTPALSSVDRHSSKLGNIVLEVAVPSSPWLRFFNGPFEIIMSAIIVLNAVSLFVSYQFTGLQVAVECGFFPSEIVWPGHADFFYFVEHAFQAIYVAEFLTRLAVLRWKFFYDAEKAPDQWETEGQHIRCCSCDALDKFNIFDATIVLLGALDMYLLPALGLSMSSIAFARMIRLARLSRTLKVIRVLKVFAKLRVLVFTVASSFMALFWSMFLLFVLMFLGASMISQHLQLNILPDDSIDKDIRQQVFQMYGTPTRAFWTMFEVTLGGQGTSKAHPVADLHWSYVLFFFVYISGVVFAVICIIQALFLKDTLEVAANDAAMMVQERIEMKRSCVRKLKELFHVADSSVDGTLSEEEFEAALTRPEVRGYMECLELEFSEVASLFQLLDNGDGSISIDEFVMGVMRLKGEARSLDVVAILRNTDRVIHMLRNIDDRCIALVEAGASGPKWDDELVMAM